MLQSFKEGLIIYVNLFTAKPLQVYRQAALASSSWDLSTWTPTLIHLYHFHFLTTEPNRGKLAFPYMAANFSQ